MSSANDPHDARAPGGLLGDDRGAIMMLGIFMCCGLVGAMWYLAGIGDAIVYRERAQEAVDATAYSSAALHARGMNLLVLLNLLMAVILGVRVTMKVLQLVCMVLGAIFTVVCVLPFGVGAWACPFPSPLFSAAQWLQDAIEQTRDSINKAIEALGQLEVGIAKGTPAAASLGGWQVATRYEPLVSFGGAWVESKRFTEGLPVERSTEDKLCEKAGESVPAVLGALADAIPGFGLVAGAMDRIRGAMGKIVRAGGAYFCEIGSGGSPPDGALDDLFSEGANEACSQKQDAIGQEFNKKFGEWQTACVDAGATCTTTPLNRYDVDYRRGPSTTNAQHADLTSRTAELDDLGRQYTRFDEDDCRKQEKKSMKDKAGVKSGQKQNEKRNQDMRPHRVVQRGEDEFFNGGNNAQTMGWVFTQKDMLRLGPAMVRAGALFHRDSKGANQMPVLAGSPKSELGIPAGFAQAEYFFDCAGNFRNDPHCDLNEESLWHFRWRARLRRYNSAFGNLNVFVDAQKAGYRATVGLQLPRGLRGLHPANAELREELREAVMQKHLDLH